MIIFINPINKITIKSLENKVRFYEINVGDKIIIYGRLKEDCINLSCELHKYGFVTRIGCNDFGDWSVYIVDRIENGKGYELNNYIKENKK